MTREIAQAVKNYLVDLAVNDKLSLDMTQLEIIDLEDVVSEAIRKYDEDNPTAFGFNHEDILSQAEEDGIELTEDEAKDIVGLIRSKGDVEIGISWDTISYFINLFVEEKNKKQPI